MAPGRYFIEWMSEQLDASPLPKKLGKTDLMFTDIRRLDIGPRHGPMILFAAATGLLPAS